MMRGITWFGLGAGLMYYLDPDRGRRRRALVRDRFHHLAHELEQTVSVGSRDLCNRTRGLAAGVGSFFGDGAAPDVVVAARVRSKLGRYVSHPRAIRVEVRGGHVALIGPILAAEADRLIEAVATVKGVRSIEPRLEVHREAGHHPALQGGIPRSGTRPEVWQETWSPAMRLLVGIAGGIAALGLLRRGGPIGLAVGALGVGLAARGSAGGPERRGHRRDVPQRSRNLPIPAADVLP